MPNAKPQCLEETTVVVVIRPDGGDGRGYGVDSVLTIKQIGDSAKQVMFRHRYNPELRAICHAYFPGMDVNVFAEALCEDQENLARLYAQATNLG